MEATTAVTATTRITPILPMALLICGIFHELQNFVLLKNGNGRLNFWQAARTAHDRLVALQQDLQNDVENWQQFGANGRETLLTKGMSITLRTYFATIVKGKDNVVNEGGSATSGRMDITFIEKNKELLALFEFSTEDGSMWWKTMDQARRQYSDIISREKQKGVKTSKSMPALLTVVTYDSKRISFRMSSFLMWWFEPDDDEKQDVMVNLWNYKGLVKDDLAKSLAIVCSVAETVHSWRSMTLEQDLYEVLGPSCARVKWHPRRANVSPYKVLRFYDSRFRRTLRNPALYLNPVAGLHGIPLSCGATGAAEDRAMLVLAVPYWEGEHVTRNPADFLAIYHELKRLHASGIVHGDIRCFNIVFNGKFGRLIDFDFSGICNAAMYPDHYNNFLVDGQRQGAPGHELEQWHDWYAFGAVVFSRHFLDERIDQEGSKEFDDFGRKWDQCGQKFLRLNSEAGIDLLVEELGCLLTVLEHGGWTCEPLNELASIVATNGETATGSPGVQKGKKRTAVATSETYDN